MSNGSFRQENVRLNQIRENFLQTKYLKFQNENLVCWELSDGQLRQAKSLSTRIHSPLLAGYLSNSMHLDCLTSDFFFSFFNSTLQNM